MYKFILYRKSNRLEKYLSDIHNHIQLIFPYIDYGLNFKDANNNKILNFEKEYELNPLITEGQILPNFIDDKSKLPLRELLRIKQSNAELPLFFIITNQSNINISNIKIFSQSIISFNPFILVNNEQGDIHIKELTSYSLVIMRPDHIIELIK
jgi:hypothetical protein